MKKGKLDSQRDQLFLRSLRTRIHADAQVLYPDGNPDVYSIVDRLDAVILNPLTSLVMSLNQPYESSEPKKLTKN